MTVMETQRSGTPKTKRPTFGVINTTPFMPIQVAPQTVDVSKHKGQYYKKDQPKDSDFSFYALRVLPANQYGETHHLLNSEFSWLGTETQFKEQFEGA
jgi:hypothetical protein